MKKFQSEVWKWCKDCFGLPTAVDYKERNHRFLEEALELVQASGCSKEDAHALVDYVYGRDVGNIKQEVGGVMVTLAALCNAQGVTIEDCAWTEIKRCIEKTPQIREKQANKPKGPLPQ